MMRGSSPYDWEVRTYHERTDTSCVGRGDTLEQACRGWLEKHGDSQPL